MIEQVYSYIIQHETQLLEILAAVVFVSRAITALTPSKADDEIVGKFERGVRKALELASGAGHRNLIVKEDVAQPEEPVIVPVEDLFPPDPLHAFERMLDRFGAEIKIVSKEKK